MYTVLAEHNFNIHFQQIRIIPPIIFLLSQCQETRYLDSGCLWFSTIPLVKCQDSTLHKVTASYNNAVNTLN